MNDTYTEVADLYDHVGPYRDRPDVPFYMESAVAAGGPGLDLVCGTGPILIPSARAGAEIRFRAFQHLLTVEDQLACLAAARGHLGPGGRAVARRGAE